MTKDQFEALLRSTACDENTIRFGINAFEMGMEQMREMLAMRMSQLPFGDTAASMAMWIREQE